MFGLEVQPDLGLAVVVGPLSAFQSAVVSSALFLALHIFLFIYRLPRESGEEHRRPSSRRLRQRTEAPIQLVQQHCQTEPKWKQQQQRQRQLFTDAAFDDAPVATRTRSSLGGKHERKDSLLS